MGKGLGQGWRYISQKFGSYFIVIALGLIALVASLPQLKTGAEFSTNSTVFVWFSNMNITIPVVIFWIIVVVVIIFLVDVTVGIVKKKYRDFDTDAKLDRINEKLDKVIKGLGGEHGNSRGGKE